MEADLPEGPLLTTALSLNFLSVPSSPMTSTNAPLARRGYK
jgi:hypothetical protein